MLSSSEPTEIVKPKRGRRVIHDLKPYRAYKHSGIPWLHDVPEHCSVIPNRATFVEVKDCDHPDEDMLFVTITKGILPQRALLADT